MIRTALFGSAMNLIYACLVVLLLSSSTSGERWSRQLTGEGHEGEWIPLQGDRRQPQAQARVLVEPQFQNTFFPQETYQQDYIAQGGARQLFVQSPNSVAQQTFVPRSQPQPIRLTLMSQFNALPQSFSFPRSNPSPYNDFRQSIQAQFHQPHLVVPPAQLNNQIYNQQQKGVVLTPINQGHRQLPIAELPKFVNNNSIANQPEIIKSSLPTLKEKIVSEYTEAPSGNQENSIAPTTPTSTTVEKEEVQLLYVPLETLQNKKFDLKQFLKNPTNDFSLRDSIGSPGQINNQLFPSSTPTYPKQDSQIVSMNNNPYLQQVNSQPVQEALARNSNFFHSSSVTPSPFSQTTRTLPALSTPKSKKLKAHQPPLAIYMLQNDKEKARLSDVLQILKQSDTVSVLDSIPPNAPKVFIGPNNLKTPPNIARFELPYLSNIDGNRIPRRIESLPFFVAPLNYKAPNGFAKIPFPAPHVGSVIVNPFMKDSDESSTIITFGSPNSFNSFPQSTTEGFRTTSKETIPTKSTIFNYYPSTTSSQNLPSSNSFSKIPNQHSNIFSTNTPESRPPSTYYSTSARPTVSFFGFSEPTFNNQPSSTNKPSSPLPYDNRGHYITNAAIEPSRIPQKSSTPYKASITERPSTSPVPHIQKNPFSFINPFILRNPYEPQDFIPNIRDDGRIYNAVERPVIQNFNQFTQNQPKFPQFHIDEHKPELQKIKSPMETVYFSSPSYPTEVSPTVSGPTISAPKHEENQQQYNLVDDNRNTQQFNVIHNQGHDQYTVNKEVLGGFVPSYNQYSNTGADIGQEVESQYDETEPPIEETTTTTTTTTTTSTTTTPAPTTRFTRRPISRGRPRYTTTPKPEGDETTLRPTTRRTPLRERRPTTYRSRTTTTTDSSVNEETTKQPRDYSRFANRQKSQDGVTTTTESSTERNKNQRFRSRGRVHFKTSDNYEGSNVISKKKNEKESDDIAYQRDVLHQNYPVTLAEKLNTLEVRTTTATPSSTLSNSENIKIYETTGSTSKSFSTSYETKPSEQPYYENEAVFQREPEKFLTHPEEYIEINGQISGRTTPIRQSVTESRNDAFSSTSTIKPIIQTVTEEHFESQLIDKLNKPVSADNEDEISHTNEYNYGEFPVKYAPDVLLTEAPVPKFRAKLKNRPKLYHTDNGPIRNGEDSQNVNSDQFITSTKKIEETTTEKRDYTRRNSFNSVTPRPSFSSRRTTMRIEEIEEELKSKRTQLRFDSNTRTNKYPIYIPEGTATTTSPSNDEVDNTTTRRTKIVRRKPIRTTTQSSIDSSATETTSEKPVNTKVRRVRVRTRVRKPTTEKAEISDAEGNNEEKYTTPRLAVQKYSTKSRQKYFKRPQNIADKHESTDNNENSDDQVYFDSINRPEIIKFNPESGNHEYVEYNNENIKDDTQWSPKTNPNAFRPIFNPNFIESRQKNIPYDYNSKLSYSEINPNEPDIITAGSPREDDILIEVTPSTNNINKPKEGRKNKEYVPEKPSTFEAVLEEVMRNFDDQETEYVTVVKHEGGEIGEIPPDTTIISKNIEDTTQSIKEVKPTTVPLPTTVAEKRYFSTASDVQTSSTERQGRRRGGWRKINVRPVHKDILESAESQFYKNSKNELPKDDKVVKSDSLKGDFKLETEANLQTTTVEDITRENVQTTEKNIKTTEPYIEEQTNYPDLIAMEVSEDDVTYSPKKEKYNNEQTTEREIITEYLINRSEEIIKENEENEDLNDETKNDEIFTTEASILAENTSEQKVNATTTTEITSFNTEESLNIETTTQLSEESQTTEEPSKSFLEVMEELLGTNSDKQLDKPVEKEKSTLEKQLDNVEIKEKELETTTAGFNFFDPKSVISTSVSTQISHETEICFRGKCIKTNKSDEK